MTEPCNCMECRIRQAISKPGQFVHTGETAVALGKVLAEVLAHCSDAGVEEFINSLRAARARWQDDPSVAVQKPHAGQA